jgi:anti-sigma factor RsiW
MQHLDEGLIHAWIDGELPPDEAARVEAHAKTCAECGALVAEARGLVAASSRIVSALDVTPGGVLPAFGQKPRRSWSTRHTGWAIAATLVIAAGTLITVHGRVNEPEMLTAVDTTTLAVKPVATPVAAPPIASPVSPPVRRIASAGTENRVAREPAAARRDRQVASAPDPATPPREAAAAPVISAPVLTARVDSAVKAAAATTIDSVRSAPLVAPTNQIASVGGGVAGGGRSGAGRAMTRAKVQSSAVAPQRALAASADMSAPSAFAGCYEVDESIDVLPKRFALITSPLSALGRGEVRYVDSTGAVDGRIPDVSWTEGDGRAVIRTNARGEVLAILRAGDTLTAQSAAGPRTLRVTQCR